MLIKGDPRFKKKDMVINGKPMSAVFQTRKKSPMYFLLDAETEKTSDGVKHALPGTGLKVRAQDFQMVVENWELFNILVNHKRFEDDAVNGFGPDPSDPGGFWRDMGVVKTKKVETYVAKPHYVDKDERASLSKKNILAAMAKKYKDEEREEAKPLAAV